MAGMMLKLLLSVLLVVLALPCHAADTGVNIDIEVFQALREGVKGIGFSNEYARIGLPFPVGMVRERNGRAFLTVEGREYQTRVLKQWPDGSVKWALVEFLASPSAGGSEKVRLVSGVGVSAGRFLAEDRQGRIVIDTGPMQVEIKKTAFNLFDRVVVGGKDIVRTGELRGAVLVDGNGKEFLASSCEDARVTIEENGPVKAAVRVDGGYCNGRERLLDFTARLFFYKGKSRATVQYTLRNASRKRVEHVFIKSMNLETKLNLDDNAKARVSTHKGEQTLDLRQGAVNYYQAVSKFPWYGYGSIFYNRGPIAPDKSKNKQRAYVQEGYWVKQGERVTIEGRRSDYADIGFLDISDHSGCGVTAGIRYMAGQWPKALKADGSGRVVVSLWPDDNKQGYWIRYGSHTTFEVMYNFHPDAATKPADEMARFQYPLAARAPVDWYNRNVEGIYPLYHFIRFSEESRLADKLGADYKVGQRKPRFRVWRYHYWGEGGFLNQHDFARIALGNFIRDDRGLASAGEYYLSSEAMFHYYADWSVYHSDDYEYNKARFFPKEHNDKANLAKVVFEWEHQHWYGMPLYYYMTGDERIREAILDWGEYVKKLANPLSLTYMRVFGTGMFSLAAMYEFTGDVEFMRLADMNFKRLLDARYDPAKPKATIFIDWERGYVAGGSGSGWSRENPGVKADLMLGSILYDGLLNYHGYMKDNNPIKAKAYELLMKISEFMLREPYFEGEKGNKKEWAYWIPYVYNLSDREKSQHGYKLAGQASFWTVTPYIETGEHRWLMQMSKMLKMALWDTDGVWGTFGYIDHPGYQTMAYHVLKDSCASDASSVPKAGEVGTGNTIPSPTKDAAAAPRASVLSPTTKTPSPTGNTARLPGSKATLGEHPLDALKPGEWYEVPNSSLADVAPKPTPGGGTSRTAAIMEAWSGGAYDTKRDRLIIWGGGHADYGGNEIYVFDISKLRWKRLTDPSPTTLYCGPLNEKAGQTDVRWNGDGTPVSRHTYDGIQYIPSIDRFWAQGGSTWCLGPSDELTWTFNFESLQWERKSDAPMRVGTPVSAYDPVTGHIFHHGQVALLEYDPIADTWQTRSRSNWQNGGNTAEIYPVRRRFVVVGNGEVFYYDISQESLLPRQKIVTSGDSEIVNCNAPGLVYHPPSDKFVAWCGAAEVIDRETKKLVPSTIGANVYTLDIDTLVWTKHEPGGVVKPPSQLKPVPHGTFGRWQYIPSKDVFIGVNSVNTNVYFYRLPLSVEKTAR